MLHSVNHPISYLHNLHRNVCTFHIGRPQEAKDHRMVTKMVACVDKKYTFPQLCL